MEDFQYEMEMEWKKIARMEYGKIIFHSIRYNAMLSGLIRSENNSLKRWKSRNLFQNCVFSPLYSHQLQKSQLHDHTKTF